MDAVLQGVSRIEDEENLLVRKEEREQGYLQILSFTAHCNWLDAVEIRFTQQDQSKLCNVRDYKAGFFPCNSLSEN